MKTRLISASVVLPVVLVSMWLGGLLFTATILIVTEIATHEVAILLTKRALNSHPFISSMLSGSIVLCGYWLTKTDMPTLAITIPFTLLSLSSVIWMLSRSKNGPSNLKNVLSTLTPALYIGGVMMQAPLIMEFEHGFYWLIVLISGTSMTDVGAYLIGKRFGRHSFFKKVSPSKTIEGAVAGLVLGAISIFIVSNLFSPVDISLLKTMILTISLPIVAQSGDLLESAIKRRSNMKDSGTMIPGHGGVLDRLDSIVFTVALLYHFIRWIGT